MSNPSSERRHARPPEHRRPRPGLCVSRHPGLVLAACSLGMSLILMDTTVVNIAAPTIRDDLDASASTLQWVINAYTLMFAALLLSMGALSDRLGARRVFLAGLVTFAAGSAAAGAAPPRLR